MTLSPNTELYEASQAVAKETAKAFNRQALSAEKEKNGIMVTSEESNETTAVAASYSSRCVSGNGGCTGTGSGTGTSGSCSGGSSCSNCCCSNTIDNLIELPVERSIDGTISCPGAKVWYRFEVPKTGMYTIFTKGNLDTIGRL